jgi:Uma2 family endonuclease
MAVKYAFPQIEIQYPDSDGQPMAESDFQREPLIYAVEALTIFFADRPDVYVSGNMFLYYERGHPELVVAPVVFVVMGVARRQRHSYKLWEEGKAPDFVLEITSHATHTTDQGPKRGLYAFLGVREYFQYDPTGDYLEPRLQGLRLRGRNYQALPVRTQPEGMVSVYSAVLGLELRLDAAHGEFRFFDPMSGQVLRSHAEAEAYAGQEAAARRAAETRAEREAAARRAAEVEVERLRAELARLRGETP